MALHPSVRASLTAVVALAVGLSVTPAAFADPPVIRDHRSGAAAVQPTTFFTARPGEYAFRFAISKDYLSASGTTLTAGPKAAGANEKFRLQTASPSWVTLEASNHAFVTGNAAGGCPNAKTCGTLKLATTLGAGDDRSFGVDREGATAAYVGGVRLWPKVQLGWAITQTGDFQRPASGVNFLGSSAMSFVFPMKCGDLGNGFVYRVRPVGSTQDLVPQAIPKLLKQSNGTYAFEMKYPTSSEPFFMTAVSGGAIANDHDSPEGHVLQFNRHAASTWEQFKIVDRGDCTYTIQTEKGFFVGENDASVGRPVFSTRISDVNAAPGIGYKAIFEFLATDI